MSNLRNTTRLPLRGSMTNKGKSYTTTSNNPSERKTRALQGNLNKLKLTTQQDQTKSNMEISRRVKSIPQYSRDQPVVSKQMIKCGQCETEEAKMKCVECVEMYCANCYSQFHLRGALQRHHCMLILTSSKKTPSVNTDTKSNIHPIEEVSNENPNVLSFQQSFLQWREDNINKSLRIHQRRGLTSPTSQQQIDQSSKLPLIDSNSSKTNSDESLLPSRYRSTNFELFPQPLTKANLSKRDQPRINVRVRVHETSSDRTSLLDLQPSNDDSSNARTAESIEILPIEENSSHDSNLVKNEEQEQPVTHASMKSLSRSNSPSRSNSITLPEQSLRSVLANKSTDELEAIVGLQLTSEEPTLNNTDAQSEERKIELPQPTIDSTTTTPRRHSPFSFSNSLYKTSRIHSASSRDTCEGGFFTDVLPRQIVPTPPLIPPPPILECSTSNEWKHALENHLTESNHILLPRLSIPGLSRPSSKHAKIVRRSKSPVENGSRPGSSLSSSSLPLSISTSSKSDFDRPKTPSSTASSRKSSSSTIDKTTSSTSTVKNSSSTTTSDTSSKPTTTSKDTSSATTTSTTTKTSSTSTQENPSSKAKPMVPAVAKDEKVPSSSDADQYFEESVNSLNEKNSSNAQISEDTNDSIKLTSSAHLTRGANITEKDLPNQKKTRRHVPRHPTTSDELSQFRKLEFSVGDGLKWQEASIDLNKPI